MAVNPRNFPSNYGHILLLRWADVLHHLLTSRILHLLVVVRYALRDGPENLATTLHEAPMLRLSEKGQWKPAKLCFVALFYIKAEPR